MTLWISRNSTLSGTSREQWG